MLVSAFAACKAEQPVGDNSAVSEIAESSQVSEVSEEPERIDGTDRYEKALDIFEDNKNFKLDSEYELRLTAGTETRAESGKRTETYVGYGEKDMAYYAESEIKHGDLRTVKIEETFLNGTTFLLYDGKGFYSAAESDYEPFLLDSETGLVKTLEEAGYNVESVEYGSIEA